MNPPRALIAEDEPLLAANLEAELARAWPALEIVARVRHGAAAVEQALALRPDVLFLDIRMPGMTGLEAARALVEDAPPDGTAPLLVFVTAYDQYAIEAFERAAFDYVLKPVQPERLAQTCGRLQQALAARRSSASLAGPGPAGAAALATTGAAEANAATSADRMLTELRRLLQAPAFAAPPATRLNVIQASVGSAIELVPVVEVLYFEAADKYVRVVTREREYLIRLSLRDLLPQLDPDRFWQIHRGTVVRHDAIATAARDESGKVHLTLRGHPDRLVASRLYAHLFKAM